MAEPADVQGFKAHRQEEVGLKLPITGGGHTLGSKENYTVMLQDTGRQLAMVLGVLRRNPLGGVQGAPHVGRGNVAAAGTVRTELARSATRLFPVKIT